MNEIKLFRLLKTFSFALLCVISYQTYAYDHLAVTIEGTLEDVRREFERLGSEQWRYEGSEAGRLIFSRNGIGFIEVFGGYRYDLDTIGEAETVQQLLDRHGDRGDLYLGFNRNYAIFLKPNPQGVYPYRYLAASFNADQAPDGIPAKFMELGRQGWQFTGQIGTQLIFRQTSPFDQYAATIQTEWQNDLPALVRQLGNEGWGYLGEGASYHVFSNNLPHAHEIVKRPDDAESLEAFLAASPRMRFRGSSDSYLIFADSIFFPTD